MTLRSRSPRPLLAVLVGALLVTGACGAQSEPREYGAEYEEDFMFGCTGVEGDAAPTLASRQFCECYYEQLVDKVSFDKAREFEREQAQATDGDDIVVPADIQAVIDRCREATNPSPTGNA
jgi:hypothetical protein